MTTLLQIWQTSRRDQKATKRRREQKAYKPRGLHRIKQLDMPVRQPRLSRRTMQGVHPLQNSAPCQPRTRAAMHTILESSHTIARLRGLAYRRTAHCPVPARPADMVLVDGGVGSIRETRRCGIDCGRTLVVWGPVASPQPYRTAYVYQANPCACGRLCGFEHLPRDLQPCDRGDETQRCSRLPR